MARSVEKTRRDILAASYVLFRQKGFTRVNVDEIALAAGVTKRTLYNHFSSKDGLLAAMLEAQHDMALAAFQTFGRKLTGTPQQIVEVLFAELFSWSASPRWPGSGFTRFAMELADLPGHPARRIAHRHKAILESHLADVLGGAGLADAGRAARQVWILIEGAMALMLIHGDRDYFTSAENAAQIVINHRRRRG